MLNKIEKMSTIIMTREGKTREIDLSLVEELAWDYEKSLFKRDNFRDRRHVDYSIKILEEIRKLDSEQLRHFISYLTGISNKLSDAYQVALDDPEKFGERINEYKKVFEKAKKFGKLTLEEAKLLSR